MRYAYSPYAIRRVCLHSLSPIAGLPCSMLPLVEAMTPPKEKIKMAKMTVEINVGVEPVARTAKAGYTYRGININGYHKPGFLGLGAAKTLLTLISDKGFPQVLAQAIAAAETRTPDPASR
jgi:hypothetical protein